MASDEIIVSAVPAELSTEHRPPPGRNPYVVYLGSLASGSRETMRCALQYVADFLNDYDPDDPRSGRVDVADVPWWKLRAEHMERIRSHLMETRSPGTANKTISALRQVLKHAWRLGLMTNEERARAADVDPVRGSRLPAGREISDEEIERLCAAVEEKGTAHRDRTIIRVLAKSGLRLDEVAHLRFESYRREERELVVIGKGNKERAVPLPASLLKDLDAWIVERGDYPGPLFPPSSPSGRVLHGRRLSKKSIYVMLVRASSESGVRSITPHDFRRTYISRMLDRGQDLGTVAKLVGHSNVQTTTRYDRRGERAKRKAVDTIDEK